VIMRSKPAPKERKAKEARGRKQEQGWRMNYNNLSCRLVLPRLSVAVPAELPPKSPVKRARKSVRRRIGEVAAAILLATGGVMMGKAAAEETGETLRLVPATETVAFTGFAARLSLDRPPDEMAEDSDLSAQIEALSTQVRMLTASTMPTVRPENAMRLSALTGVLLCAGLGVAIVRAGLLFRSDVAC
jgi:hypothetical protein